ncbi:MAG: hypothetical protein KF689_07165 [Gemmatimonadaceae bacterium]|nr:hypothetical protein [Gemmatimonadaceae bacterium]MCW5825050.1 hypothetical protein [Gemmatimonadaceae bacterium]
MNTPRLTSRRTLRAAVLAAALGGASLSACGPDPFAPVADSPVVLTTFTVWAITGTPPPFPTAFSLPANSPLRLEPSGSFDIAFDITPEGKLQILPMGAVVSPPTGPRPIGINVPGVSYQAITAAPRSGWNADSTIEVTVGQAFVLQVPSVICPFNTQQVLYGKFVAESIIVADRRIFMSARINPNCGFRSFADGIPRF